MMRLVILLIMSVMTIACSTDHATGVHAAIYEKTNHYTFDIKRGDNAQLVSQITHTVTPSLNRNASNRVTINCKTAKAKAFAKQVKVRLVKHGVAPSHIDIKSAHGLTHDLVITHASFGLKTQHCAVEMIGRTTQQIGCYVDSLRLKQLSHPEHLYSSAEG
ncbi:hypothetical protein [Photobacterium leiognathi]|uniref:hypothetical protein n=1 Tax=Photobacterium leiognathi TaxID=553611 RepID=UPI0029812F38|nr:hypothetical protein [Photobacterium leiognathi]